MNSLQEEKSPFIKIDSKNTTTFITDQMLSKLKISLYNTLASIEEEVIGREINKYFDRLVPNGEMLKVNIVLSKILNEQYKKQTKSKISEDVKSYVGSIINYSETTEFVFSRDNTEELSKVVAHSFLEIDSHYTHIKNYKELLESINIVNGRNVDIIKKYLNREKRSHMNSVCSNSTKSSVSLISGSNNVKNKPEYTIPIEMLILLDKFFTVKKVKFVLPDECQENEIQSYILILLNLQWLFPNLLEIELDTNLGIKASQLHDKYFEMDQRTTTRKSTLSAKKLKSSYMELVKQNRTIFDLLIIYSYFIAKCDTLKILTLNFPETFQNESEMCLMYSDAYVVNFQFLNFFNSISGLFQINFKFNSLDTNSFDKIIALIHKNNKLTNLKLNLFTNEEEYNHNALYKLCSVLKLNVQKFNEKVAENVYENEEEYFLTRLLESFEESLEKLIFILDVKHLLYYLELKGDLPRLLSTSEKFTQIMHKFVFNIFIMLNQDNSSVHTLKINFPFLSFDNRKFLGISKFLESLKFQQNAKRLKNLHVNLHFNKVPNLINIITDRLVYIEIGTLDSESLQYLGDFLSSKHFVKTSQLSYLKILLSNLLFDYRLVQKSFLSLLNNPKPVNMKEIHLHTNLILKEEYFRQIFNYIRADTVEKYHLEFNNKSAKEFKETNLPKMIYYTINYKLNKKIVKILHTKKKSLLKTRQVFNTIRDLLQNYQKKDLSITFK